MRTLRDTYRMLDKVYTDAPAYLDNVIELTKIVDEQEIRTKHDTISCLAKYQQYPKERFDSICEKYKSKEYSEEEYGKATRAEAIRMRDELNSAMN